MSDRSVTTRRPIAMGAAVLLAAAAFLATSSGPVGAGGPSRFTITPASAEVGDVVTVASDDRCPTGDGVSTAEVRLIDASDVEVSLTSGPVDLEGNWTVDVDTTGLDGGTYTVKARCVKDNGRFSNYISRPLTLTAAVEPTTTTTTEVETTTSEPTTSTTEAPGTTTEPAGVQPNAAPAAAVASTPSYTG